MLDMKFAANAGHVYDANKTCTRCRQTLKQVTSAHGKPCTDIAATETARLKDRDAGLFRAVGNSR